MSGKGLQQCGFREEGFAGVTTVAICPGNLCAIFPDSQGLLIHRMVMIQMLLIAPILPITPFLFIKFWGKNDVFRI